MRGQTRQQPSPEPSPRRADRATARWASGLCHGDNTADWQDAHDALKRDDQLWQRAELAGLQIDGQTLWEVRLCPSCRTSVLRAISPASALGELQGRLNVLAQSLSTLAHLAQSQ